MASAAAGWIGARPPGLPSASDLARAASTAATKASRDRARLEHRDRGLGRAPWRRDVAAQLRGRLGRRRGERCRPGERLLGEAARDRRRQPHLLAGVEQRLEDEEDVRRPRAGERGDGVELRFVAEPDQLAGRAEQRDRVGAVVLGHRGAGVEAGDALADQRRRVRHRPDDALAAGRGDDRFAADSRHDADVQGAGDLAFARPRGSLERLRLDRPDDDLGDLDRRPGRRPARSRRSGRRACAGRLVGLDDDDRGAGAAGLDQAADQRLRHVAAADEDDVAHGAV